MPVLTPAVHLFSQLLVGEELLYPRQEGVFVFRNEEGRQQ